jgi:DNA-binding IclR family transcriptional regulator
VTKERRGIQSIEVGGRLLNALLQEGGPMALSKLALRAEMPAASAHPYLVSFGKLGLISQDLATGFYDFGPLALELGLASLHRLNPIRLALPAIAELAARTGHTTALAVLGNRGPTIVHLEESTHPIHVNMRPGTVMSLLGTATGRVFAAYLPPKLAEQWITAELRGLRAEGAKDGRPSWKQIEATLAEVRRRRLDRALGRPIPSINAFSAPVFDHTRAIALAITVVGTEGAFDSAWDGNVAKQLLSCAAGLSRRLGYFDVSATGEVID